MIDTTAVEVLRDLAQYGGPFAVIVAAVLTYYTRKQKIDVDKTKAVFDGYERLVKQQQDQIASQQEQIASLISELEETRGSLMKVTTELERRNP